MRTDDLDSLSSFEAVVPADDRKGARRFRRNRDRFQFLLARGLLSFALSEHLLVCAAD
jgi:hypothetical protein